MGLDMYLSRVPKVDSIQELTEMNSRLDKAYLNGELIKELAKIHKEKEYIYDIDFSINKYVDLEKYKQDTEGCDNLLNLEIRVAYWRKFNALHSWFVKNVQHDNDDCGTYIVTKDDLVKLKETLNSLTKENAGVLFPPQSGFFFGGTELDEYYWQSVESLKATVHTLISQQPYDTSYVYSSSW